MASGRNLKNHLERTLMGFSFSEFYYRVILHFDFPKYFKFKLKNQNIFTD